MSTTQLGESVPSEAMNAAVPSSSFDIAPVAALRSPKQEALAVEIVSVVRAWLRKTEKRGPRH